MPKNYYRILGIEKDADVDDIKKAYRALAKKYHPDVNATPGIEQIFIEITEAYEYLINKAESKQKVNVGKEKQHDINEEYWQQVRRRAAEQARMKYEKFAREHEAFKASGYYDLSLIFKILGRAFIFLFTITLFVTPVILGFIDLYLLLFAFLCWPVAVFQAMYIYEKRKNYFVPEKFYYNFKKVREYYTERNPDPEYKCFYCKGLKADSKPYKIYLLKVKDVKTISGGPFQRRVSYKKAYKNVKVPRSCKALQVHSLNTLLKTILVLVLPFFIPCNSLLWKLITTIIITLSISLIINCLTRTASKVGYMLNRFYLTKIMVWLGVLILLTDFSDGFIHWNVHEAIFPVFGLMVFFDPVIELIIKIPGQAYMLKPLLPRYRELNRYFDNKYQYYIDVPVWTLIYPFFKWIFG